RKICQALRALTTPLHVTLRTALRRLLTVRLHGRRADNPESKYRVSKSTVLTRLCVTTTYQAKHNVKKTKELRIMSVCYIDCGTRTRCGQNSYRLRVTV